MSPVSTGAMFSPLSLHERYSVARGNVGAAPIITLILRYEDASDLPLPHDLVRRIDRILEIFPILACHVAEAKSRTPYFKLLRTGDERENRELALRVLRNDRGVAVMDIEDIILRECEDKELSDTGREDTLWKVTRYLPSQNDSGFTSGLLALSAHHAVNDGVGMLNLLHLLLQPQVEFDRAAVAHTAKTPTTFPTYNHTINLKPPMLYMLGVVFKELIVPKLPSLLGGWLSSGSSWPADGVIPNPTTCSPKQQLITLPGDVIAQAKETAGKHGVTTLHPVIHIAATFALWQAIVRRDGRPATTALRLAVGTPMDDRKSHPDHPMTGSNYVCNSNLDCAVSSSTEFWDLCGIHSRRIKSPEGRAEARAAVGMLAYIPDPADHVPRHGGIDVTGFEAFLLDKASGRTPFTLALETSNVGLAPEFGVGAGDVLLAQTSSRFASALSLGVVGNRASGNVSVVASWMEGAGMDLELVRMFAEGFERAFAVLAGRGEQGTNVALTFGQLSEMTRGSPMPVPSRRFGGRN